MDVSSATPTFTFTELFSLIRYDSLFWLDGNKNNALVRYYIASVPACALSLLFTIKAKPIDNNPHKTSNTHYKNDPAIM